MSAPDLLPDCRTSFIATPRGATPGPGGFWVPLYCGNCGTEGGKVPEENMTFAFWLCGKCEHLGQIAGTMQMPDEIFYAQVKQAQLEKYGRIPTAEEVEVLLADPESLESLLARSRAAMTPKGGG